MPVARVSASKASTWRPEFFSRQRSIRPGRWRLMFNRRPGSPANETIFIIQFRPRRLYRLGILFAVESFEFVSFLARLRARG